VAYDITNENTYQDVHNWMSEVEKHASDNVSRILVGNKCDLEDKRDVSKE
jgi:GTPase SAR1 family protein